MKRLSLILVICLCALSTMVAQRTVSGRVTGSDGTPLIGAAVQVKGTQTGTVTDADGKYRLMVPAGNQSLMISYVGYDTQEIPVGVSNVVDAVLAEGIILSETVISAVGLQRNKSEVVYANQTVNSEELNGVSNRSVLNALQGKTAGVKIGQASGGVGASTRVVLRGETSLTQGNNALIVVDGIPINNTTQSGGGGTGKLGDRDNYVDFGNRANDINPDDVESVTVLKGPAATSLYGSRGGSGVVLITTKKGKMSADNKPKVTIGSAFSVDRAYLVFKPQEQYGSGYASCGGCGGTTEVWMGENFAWGKKFDKNLILPWTALPVDENGNPGPLTNGKTEQLFRPYTAVKDNIQNFFDIGNSLRNNISVTGGSEKWNYHLAYTNFLTNGIVAHTNSNKNNILFNFGAQVTKNLKTDFNFNYTKSKIRGSTEGGYSFGFASGTPAYAFALQTPPNIPLNEVRDYHSPYHDFNGYFAAFSINPYFILAEQKVENNIDNVIASATANYKFNDWISLIGSLGTNFSISTINENIPVFNYAESFTYSDGELVHTGRGGGTNNIGGYKNANNRYTDLNYDLKALLNRKITDNIKWNFILGFNSIENKFNGSANQTVGGLVIPGYYSLSNSAQPALGTGASFLYRLYGFYANTSFGFNEVLFGELSGRYDKSSTLPKANNGFLYGAVGASWVPTNSKMWNNDKINYLKIRGSYGSAGKDAPRYRLNSYYVLNPLILDYGDDYQIRFPVDGYSGSHKSNRIGNPDLKPELSLTAEIGFDLGLLNDRLGIEYTYYSINSKNQIVDVSIPWSSGFSEVPVNIGRMTNKGHELLLKTKPIVNDKFKWNVNLSWSKNNNKVVTIEDDGDDEDKLVIFNNLVHFAGHGTLNLVAKEGLPFGTYEATDYVYKDGKLVVNLNGNPEQSTTPVYKGSYQPDWLATLSTDFSWKGFTLGILLDKKQGGVFYSGTKLSTEFNGTASTTLLHNRENFVITNSLAPVVDADGNIVVDANGNTTYQTNAISTQAYGYFKDLPASAYLVDGSYLKLRELTLDYNIPVKKINLGLESVSIGVFAKNLKYWLPKENTFADPEVGGVGANGDAFGTETSTTPSAKSFGIQLKAVF